MEYKRIIRFQYYRIMCKEKIDDIWGEYRVFNLVDWIMRMTDKSMLHKTVDFNRVSARIEEFKYDRHSDLWGIRFMKLRDTNIPTKVKENEAAEIIELKDDEYIGEDVVLLYEKKSSLAMVQCNRFSLGVSRLQEFINFTNNDKDTKIFIQPILLLPERKSWFKRCNYKSIDISFANLGRWTEKDNDKQSLSSIISTVKKIGGLTAHIKIALGNTRTSMLDRIESQNIVEEVYSNKEFIRNARVKIRDDDDTAFEIVDLFEDAYHDFLEFTLQVKTALEFSDAMKSMIYTFGKRKNSLYSAIGYIDKDDSV